MEKVDYKKTFKNLYLPSSKPIIVDVPMMRFAILEGKGNPNEEEFSIATAALYSFSYGVKMSYKSKKVPEGYYEYTVFPLEGVWDLVDKSKGITDKSNLTYSIMIRQPDFLTDALFERVIQETIEKKPNPFLEQIYFSTITEGLCCQMLHRGSYDDEPASFEQMEGYCEENGYERISKIHREIYLSDPRKTEASKLKTVLRFSVAKK